MSDEKRLYVWVHYDGDAGEVFIYRVDGWTTVQFLAEVEAEAQNEESEHFGEGAGEYLFLVRENPAQTGEFGMVEVQAWLELTCLDFKPMSVVIAEMDNRA